MKPLISLFCFIILFCNLSFAQLSNNPVYKNIDISKISPDQVPSEEELLKMGASPEEIKALMEYKNKNQSLPSTSSLPSTESSKKEFSPDESSNIETVEQEAYTVEIQADSENISQEVKVFGQDFFKNRNLKFFDKASDAKASDNYILAPDDEISISVWGYSAYNESFVIDKDGAIKPTETGRIYLKGLKFSDAKSLITKKFGQIFDLNNSKIEITLVYSRVITVNIVGEVVNPGSYSISAVNTAFNALVAANGITPNGSVRKIYVKRAGKTIKTLDIYEYLLNPDSNEDFYLEDNDYIFVPLAEKVVSVSGGVKRPLQYELIENENLETLINYAGGLTANAYSQAIQVKRINNNRLVIADVSLDSLLLNKKIYELMDGDIIYVKSISGQEENYVEIDGAVRIPGRYELKKGEKISDLIAKAEGIIDETYLDRAYLIRKRSDLTKEYIALNLGEIVKNKNSSDNLKLQKYDVLTVFSQTKFLDYDSISVIGYVREPQNIVFGEGMTVKDAIYFTGGFKKEAANNRIEISRVINFLDTTKRVIIMQAEINKDLSLPGNVNEFKLQPYDIIFVRKIAQFSYQENVEIDGEINYPGIYTIKENERLSDLIERAGGLTTLSFIEGATLFRSEKNIGYLFLDLKKVIKKPSSNFNYILKDGDKLFIPKINELVAIKGAIKYPDIDKIKQINAPFTRHKRAGFYVKEYGGGFEKRAARGKTYVIEPGGFIKNTYSIGCIHIYPKVKKGATVYALYKEEKAKKNKEDRDPINWNTVIENTTVKITGVLTLWILVSQVVDIPKL